MRTLNNRDRLYRTTCHESHIWLKAFKNILGRSVAETGGCGVYHAVHIKHKEEIKGLQSQQP